MFRGLYTGYTGMRTQQEKMDTIANNLSNADTVGYKKDRIVQASFNEVLTLKMNDPEKPISEAIGKMSLGSRIDQVFTDHTQGNLKQTDESMDIALQGRGFLVVGLAKEDGTYATRYTRDGSLKIDQQGRLVTGDGLFVLGADDQPINLTTLNFRINKDGSIYEKEELVGQLKLVSVTDEKSMRKEGNSLYITTEATELTDFGGTVEQGFLESSNANSIEEMINMIATMRSYEANSKIIQTYDATMEKVVNNVGAVR